MIRLLFVLLLFIFLVALFAAASSKPVLNGNGLSWDNSLGFERLRTHEAIELGKQEVEKVKAGMWNETLRLIAYLAAGVLTVFFVVQGIPAMLAAFRRDPIPPEILLLAGSYLARRPDAELDIVEGDWCIVHPPDEEGVRDFFPVAYLPDLQKRF